MGVLGGIKQGLEVSFSVLGCWRPALPTDQPDNPSEENCGVIRTESSGGWQNRDCSIALPYVCKKKPNATAEPVPPGELSLFTASPLGACKLPQAQ